MFAENYRSAALLACFLSVLACEGDPAPQAESAAAPGASAGPDGGPAAGGSAERTVWEGEVTGGYQGNRLSFTLSPDASQVEDVTFEGHWDCADGIETTTAGPDGSFPVENGRLEITSVDPPDGGATATRFVLAGQLAEARAEGTVRININALGCDTGELAWSAAPAAE